MLYYLKFKYLLLCSIIIKGIRNTTHHLQKLLKWKLQFYWPWWKKVSNCSLSGHPWMMSPIFGNFGPLPPPCHPIYIIGLLSNVTFWKIPLPPKWVTSFMDSPKYFKKSSALTFFCCMGVGLGDLDLGLEGGCAWRPLPFCMPDGWWGVMLLPEEDGRNLLWSSWDNLLLKRKEKSSHSSTSVFYLIKKVFTAIDY